MIFIFITSYNTWAFKWDNCRKLFWSGGSGIFAVTTAPASTASYVSSTGKCSALAQTDEGQKKIFIGVNIEQLKIDSARGAGEHIEAYAYLSQCDGKSAKELPIIFRENFFQIYGENLDKSVDEIYDSMEMIMKSDLIISSGCKQIASLNK